MKYILLVILMFKTFIYSYELGLSLEYGESLITDNSQLTILINGKKELENSFSVVLSCGTTLLNTGSVPESIYIGPSYDVIKKDKIKLNIGVMPGISHVVSIKGYSTGGYIFTSKLQAILSLYILENFKLDLHSGVIYFNKRNENYLLNSFGIGLGIIF